MAGYSPLPRIELDPRAEAELVAAAARRVYEASGATLNDFSAGSPIMALLEGQERLADDIIAYRDGLAAGMVSIAELLDIKSVNQETFKDLAERVTTRSGVFTVQTKASSFTTGGQYNSEAVVDRNATPTRIVYLYQGVMY